jgi:hypothetical protein
MLTCESTVTPEAKIEASKTGIINWFVTPCSRKRRSLPPCASGGHCRLAQAAVIVALLKLLP